LKGIDEIMNKTMHAEVYKNETTNSHTAAVLLIVVVSYCVFNMKNR
jgi:hypothetical protein